MELLKASGPAALKQFRESGDPARNRAARAKIGRKTAANNAVRAAWRRAHPSGANVVIYERDILPYLATISARQIAEVTSLSRNYASTIKSARFVPHERHWDALRRLIASPSDTATGGRDEHGVSRQV